MAHGDSLRWKSDVGAMLQMQRFDTEMRPEGKADQEDEERDGQACGSSRRYERYRYGHALVLGIVQVVLGALCAILAIPAFSLSGNIERYHNEELMYGMWTGVWFILAGAFGIAVAKRRGNCKVITFSALSAVAAVMAVVCIVMAALALDGIKEDFDNDWVYPNHEAEYRGKRAVNSLILVCALAECVAATWSCALIIPAPCCRT